MFLPDDQRLFTDLARLIFDQIARLDSTAAGKLITTAAGSTRAARIHPWWMLLPRATQTAMLWA